MEDTLEKEEVLTVVEEQILPKLKHSYTFTCSKCGKNVCINSDLYNKIEDKKAQHKCSPKNKI